MRPPLTSFTGNVTDTSSRAILWASMMLLASACMQLATTWMQSTLKATSTQCNSRAAPPVSSSGSVWLDDTPYTWQADDYPATLPLDLREPVALTTEDTRHYALDSVDAEAEYRSLYPGNGRGFLRLGPRKRFFGISMYHQLHCLSALRQAILDARNGASHDSGGDGGHSAGHSHGGAVDHSAHCLNYLRETILCAADVTLEPEIVEGSQDVGNGNAVTHVCRDWSRVREFALKNHEAWEALRKGNITGTED